MTKLTSMKLPPRKPTAEEKLYTTMCDPSSDPEYPYGLCLNIEDKQLDALGMKALPKMGATVSIQAKAVITGVNENQSQSGTNRSVSIQITDMAVE